MIVVSLASILVEGGVFEVGTVDEEFTREASVLAEEVGEAGFLSLAEVEGKVAELVLLVVTLESEIVAGVGVIVDDDLVEATTLLTDEVETGVATAEGVDVGLLEVAVEVEVVEEVVEAVIASLMLGAEVLDLVMVKEV